MKHQFESVKIIPLEDQITHLLNELRIVLPGTQAILGFQFASVFTDQFHRLSQTLQNIHLISLCFVLLSITILLGAPAFNRIVEPNKATEKFHGFASKVVLIALFFLSCGMSIELYVIGMTVTHSEQLSIILSAACFLLSLSLWFGYSFFHSRKG
jgi:hypothetical protein